MTGEQSRLLKIGDRVCWENSATDRGTVTENHWSGIGIFWDNGHRSSHLDRARSAVVINLVFTIFVHPNFVRCVGHLCAFGSRHRFVAVAAF